MIYGPKNSTVLNVFSLLINPAVGMVPNWVISHFEARNDQACLAH